MLLIDYVTATKVQEELVEKSGIHKLKGTVVVEVNSNTSSFIQPTHVPQTTCSCCAANLMLTY